MSPEDVENIIGRADIDDEIDNWSCAGVELRPPETVTLTMFDGNLYSSLQDLAFEILADNRRAFAEAKRREHSSEACTAKDKIILARQILHQTLPWQDRRYRKK